MGSSKFEILRETRPLHNPLYLWARVESFDVPEQSSDKNTATIVSLDALACEDPEDLGFVSPAKAESLRHITLHFSRPDSRGGPAEVGSGYQEGDWLRLTLSAYAHGPLGFVEGPFPSLMSDNESAGGDHPVFFGRVAWIRRAEPDEIIRLSRLCRVDVIIQDGKTPLSNIADADGLNAQHQELLVRVVDVGQASCNAIHSQPNVNSVLGFYDVGRPLWFQSKSWPTKPPAIHTPKDAFVVLSHWDYDHYSMALGYKPALLDLKWYAPFPLHPGPIVKRVITRLGSNLSFITAATQRIFRGVLLYACTGPANNRNQCGYAMQVQTSQGNILLTGDADYQYIPLPAQHGLKGLVISHHGGTNTGTPPTPLGSLGNAVVSFGIPNKYNHPESTQINRHASVGWVVIASNWTKHPNLAPIGVRNTRRKDHWL